MSEVDIRIAQLEAQLQTLKAEVVGRRSRVRVRRAECTDTPKRQRMVRSSAASPSVLLRTRRHKLKAVSLELSVGGDDAKLFKLGLGQQHAIKGISMMRRQLWRTLGVLGTNGQ
jgi:hypothetical protein